VIREYSRNSMAIGACCVVRTVKRESSTQRQFLGRFSRLRWRGLCRLDQSAGRTRRNTSIHKQRLSRDVPAGLRREEYHCGVQILRLARTFQWNAIAKVLDPFFVFVQNLILFRTRSFVPHHDGRNATPRRTVVTVDVAAADAASSHADKNFTLTWCWIGKIGNFQMFVSRKQKSFHQRVQPFFREKLRASRE